MAGADPWDDNWTASSPSSTQQQSTAPGVIVVESNDQVRKLFSLPRDSTAADDSARSAQSPIKYEVQSSTPGSHYKPQLRILKRAQDQAPSPSLTSADAQRSSGSSSRQPGETETERLERVRREKEAKYRAARERVFGSSAESGGSGGKSGSHSPASPASGSSVRSSGGNSTTNTRHHASTANNAGTSCSSSRRNNNPAGGAQPLWPSRAPRGPDESGAGFSSRRGQNHPRQSG